MTKINISINTEGSEPKIPTNTVNPKNEGMSREEKVPTTVTKKTEYTCPMHPQIIKDAPGSCPICGMDLVPKVPAPHEEDKTYKELVKKFKIALLFTLPIMIITMSDMSADNPLLKIINQYTWNWIQFALSIPVIFYATRIFLLAANSIMHKRMQSYINHVSKAHNNVLESFVISLYIKDRTI